MAGVQADLDRWNTGNDADYTTTVRVAITKVAWDVLVENPNTVNHSARAVFANKVLNSVNGIASKVALILASKDILATNIESTLATQWDNITGLL